PVKEKDKEEGFDPVQFVETSRHDLGQLLTEVRTLATKHIEDGGLRGLVLDLLETHAQALLRLPATRARAFSFRGGLLEHTVTVPHVAIALGERYAQLSPELRPPLNRDLITAGAILHDIGRVLELGDESPTPGYTVSGKLAGPLVLGRDLVRDAGQRRD